MGFTKLDSGIVQSSIMMEDSDTFKAWIVFLASCDSDGIARVSPVYISSICHFDIEKTMQIINKLSSPDEYSRSTNDEGKRIERVDGGYRIINYLKYREHTYSNSPDAIRKREKRRESRTRPDTSGHSPDTLSSASSSVSSSSSSVSVSKKKKKEFIKPTLDEVKDYFRDNGYKDKSAATFYRYYECANWKDSTDKPVKNWKQKAIAVWFKDENKICSKNNDNYNPYEAFK